MDRFIVQLDGYTTVPYWHLKSNMDRFIEYNPIENYSMIEKFKIQYGQIYRKHLLHQVSAYIYLKSNMDRFIVSSAIELYRLIDNLKSNMDRFIVCHTCFKPVRCRKFKIQYGQIYR